MTVEVASVSIDVPVQVFGLGTVGARVQSNVGFKVAGVLVALDADSGDRVSAGSVLARLDAREVAAQLGQANAGVLQARASLVKADADVTAAEANRANAAAVARRRSELAKGGHASVEEAQTTRTAELTAIAVLGIAHAGVDVAEASVTAAEAQVTYAQAVLDNYTLRAPYDALVVARNLQLGAMPVPGQAVFTLVDPTTIWVLGYVDERLAGGIALGQPAEITLRSEPGRHHPGHVARIEIQSDAVNEERLVEVAFDDIPRDIHLAEQAEVVITTGSLDHAVLVPQTAVTGLNGSHGTVWTVEDGKLAQTRRDSRCAPAQWTVCRSSIDCRRASRSSSHRPSGLRRRTCGGDRADGIEMNLALRDVRHNALRFALTALGLGLLFGVVISMTGIYEGALDDALRLPRASSPDLWVVQPRTHGPFAEPSRIPRDTRDLVRRIPGVAAAGAVTFQTVQTVADGKPLRMFVQGYEPGRPGGPQRLAAGADITASHYQIVIDTSSGLRLGQQIPLGPLRSALHGGGPDQRHGDLGGRPGRLGHAARRAIAAVRLAAGAGAA